MILIIVINNMIYTTRLSRLELCIITESNSSTLYCFYTVDIGRQKEQCATFNLISYMIRKNYVAKRQNIILEKSNKYSI